jgi:hypothetical protein
MHAAAGFEPAIALSEWPQTNALDRTATGIGRCWYLRSQTPPLGTERSTGKKNIMQIIEQVTESVDTCNKTTDGEFRYVGHYFNKCVVYFLNVRLFHGTGWNVISLTAMRQVRAFPGLIIAKIVITSQQNVQMCAQAWPKSDNNCGVYDRLLRRAITSGILRRFSRNTYWINFLDIGVYRTESYRYWNKSVQNIVKI